MADIFYEMANMGDIFNLLQWPNYSDKLFDHVDFVKAMLDFFLQPCDTVTFVFTLYDVKQRLNWPGISVLTVITVEAVLPAIAEIAITAATL